jgi:ATP-dependent Clp protease ATP-binding subunit ClpX
MPPRPPSPKQIAQALSARVIGQPEAVSEMAIALAKHFAGLSTGNVLMIGSSGSGKTTLMRAVEAYLASDPQLYAYSALIRIHANVLGEEAETGRPGQGVLRRLLERSREQLPAGSTLDALLDRAGSGVVFVDEVDKIRSRIGGLVNVAGIRAQEALLTLIENEAVPLDLPAWAGGGTRNVDSRRLLFVCAGAFEGLYDSVYDRVTVGKDRGSLQPFTVVDGSGVREQLQFALRDWLRNEDLFDYGMTPQFLARFDSVVLLEDLREDELVRIFLETPDSSYRQACAFFEAQGIHLGLSPAAVRRIAAEAAQQPRLGARALREVFRRVIRRYEYDPAPFVAAGALLLDVAEVERELAHG